MNKKEILRNRKTVVSNRMLNEHQTLTTCYLYRLVEAILTLNDTDKCPVSPVINIGELCFYRYGFHVNDKLYSLLKQTDTLHVKSVLQEQINEIITQTEEEFFLPYQTANEEFPFVVQLDCIEYGKDEIFLKFYCVDNEATYQYYLASQQ